MGAVVSGSMVQPATPSAEPVQLTASSDPIGTDAVLAPLARFCRLSSVPLKTLISTGPWTPGTVAASVYCQNV